MYRILFLSVILTEGLTFAAPPIVAPSFQQPLHFEPNRGQAPVEAKWIGHGPGYQLLLSSDGLTMKMRAPSAPTSERPSKTNAKYDTIQMKLEGGRPWDNLTGLKPTGGSSSYYIGNDRKAWRTGIPHYSEVRANSVYDGIDLVLYGSGSNLEYDLVVKPGADPEQIRLAFEGADHVRLDRDSGDLLVTTANGSEIRESRPKVYQQNGDKRVEIAGSYKLLDHGHAKFELAAYDRTKPLIIDPAVAAIVLNFGAFNASDTSFVGVDANGFIYVTGTEITSSTDSNIFLAVVSPEGTLVRSAYFGGTAWETPSGIAVDSSGVYIAGETSSPDFPLGNYTYTERFGEQNLFIAKLDAYLNLQYATVVGGTGATLPGGMAVDPVTHNVYMTGTSEPYPGYSDFPQFGNAPKHIIDPGEHVVEIHVDADGSPVDSVVLGAGRGVATAVDVFGGIWMTGTACGPNFPFTIPPGTPLPSITQCSGFLSHYAAGFAALTFSREFAWGTAITTDPAGNVYVGGNGLGNYTPLVEKFDNQGNPLIKKEFTGANGVVTINAIALNLGGDVYVAGSTNGTTFPGASLITPPTPNNPDYSVAFLTKLPPTLNAPVDYTIIGGSLVTSSLVLKETLPWTTGRPQIYTAGKTYANGGPPNSYQTVPIFRQWADDIQYVRILNHWIGDEYINIESRVPAAGLIGPDWWSAQWTFELQPTTNGDPENTPVYWIHNRWQPDASGEYLNIESGPLTSSSIGAGWLSARWTIEPVTGAPDLYRICNVWKPDLCLNIQSGTLQASPIRPGWWSAMWSIEHVY